MNKSILFSLLFIIYLLSSPCNGDIIERKQLRDRSKRRHRQKREYNAYDQDEDNSQISGAHVVVSKEGPPPSPQEYTISKLEKAVVCDARGDKTWAKWKEYDLDGVCARLQYYGEIEGQCETDCDLLCPQGFYEVAKEPCKGGPAYGVGSGYYRQCVGRYKCTQTSYDYWVNLKWWQFLIWEVVIIILGCCFFGLAVGCCLRCRRNNNNNNNSNNRGNQSNSNNNNRGSGGGGGGGSGAQSGRGYDNNNNRDNNNRGRGGNYNNDNNRRQGGY